MAGGTQGSLAVRRAARTRARTCIQIAHVYLYADADMHTSTPYPRALTHTLPPPQHLCAVCLKWQCLSVILRQIGREHRSIKGSHGAAEG